jgi:ABC-2 type transport system ATP-binding protein
MNPAVNGACVAGPSRAVAEYAIATDALCRDFGGQRAVDDLTLRIAVGQVFGLLGPNGAGKTTTIRLLLGLLDPSNGSARVFGLDTRTERDAIRSCAGALLEHTGLYERLNAEDNLEFYARVWRMPSAVRRARIGDLLAHFGLWSRRRETIATWSRGMKQKLAIARAILHRPRLLLLDEPTAGLDPVAAAALRDDLSALVAREHVTVLLTTHNLPSLCAKVGIIGKGRLLATGTPTEICTGSHDASLHIAGRGLSDGIVATLRSRPEVVSVTGSASGTALTIGLEPGADAAALVSFIVSRGGEVERVHRLEGSLETAFRNLILEGS